MSAANNAVFSMAKGISSSGRLAGRVLRHSYGVYWSAVNLSVFYQFLWAFGGCVGKWIVFEGAEGVGKSSTMRGLLECLVQKKLDVIATREPGGTPFAESLRHLLLHTESETIFPLTELLLMFAGRVQHLEHKIFPALEKGQWVLCDRFIDASFAYQGAGRGIDDQTIETLGAWVVGHRQPDCIFLLDCPSSVGLERVKARSVKSEAVFDRFEQEEISFFERIRQKYLERAKRNPERYEVISTEQPPEQVLGSVISALEKRGWV